MSKQINLSMIDKGMLKCFANGVYMTPRGLNGRVFHMCMVICTSLRGFCHEVFVLSLFHW